MNIGPGPHGKGFGISFGIDDFTKEAEDMLMRKEIVQLLADRGIGTEELCGRIRVKYIEAGMPCGTGAAGVVAWLERI